MRGTTPTHCFTLSFDTSLIEKCSVTYKQDGVTKLKKNKDDCICSENKLIVVLTQEESLLFNEDSNDFAAEVQLKVKLNNTEGTVFISPIYKIYIGEVFDTEIF